MSIYLSRIIFLRAVCNATLVVQRRWLVGSHPACLVRHAVKDELHRRSRMYFDLSSRVVSSQLNQFLIRIRADETQLDKTERQKI